MQFSDAQQMLLRQWAEGTGLDIDTTDTPKRQFNVVAKALGWLGGGDAWNVAWNQCFDEIYVWRGHSPLPARHGDSDRLETPSETGSAPSLSENDSSDSTNDHGVWGGFKGFNPDPTASFVNEFRRLCKHQRWNREQISKKRVELFDSDFHAHFGNDVGDLSKWQEFCRLCSINPVPQTIMECMEALEVVLVNIYDLLDHERSGAPIVPFDTFEDFADYTIHGRCYPLDQAKSDTFLPVFLKELYPKCFRR